MVLIVTQLDSVITAATHNKDLGVMWLLKWTKKKQIERERGRERETEREREGNSFFCLYCRMEFLGPILSIFKCNDDMQKFLCNITDNIENYI